MVVAVNRFHTDTDNEIKLLEKMAKDAGAEAAVLALQQPDELNVNSLRELYG